ncbi:MAG: adenylate/guanylate cyclase domain-containing protein, partial [Gammaproteobacteria bacterium]|nr:adenylate/guanylate cyclase domain-containing protein [Gammaproteobacteria bacterium]
SQNKLNISSNISKWPRSLHTRLINELTRNQVRTISFDIFFRENRSTKGDEEFAAAIKRSGNVILFEYTKFDRVINVSENTESAENIITAGSLIHPLPILAESAAATAPFPLPQIPAKISQAWLFKPDHRHTPTLPVATFQLYNKELEEYLKFQTQEHTTCQMVTQLKPQNNNLLRQCFIKNPELKNKIINNVNNSKLSSDYEKQQLINIVNMYSGPNSRHLNYYGPRYTINTIPYYKALELLNSDEQQYFSGKSVFVGYSEKLKTEHKDDFYIAYPDNSEFVSGVEIAATLFSNLVQNNLLRPTSPLQATLIIIMWSTILLILLRQISMKFIVPAGVLIAGLYFFISFWAFREYSVWIPIVTPLFFQIPFVILIIYLWRLYEVTSEKNRIRNAFSYHLPEGEVDRIANNISFMNSELTELYGICLATDAGRYTSLSEKMKPENLRVLMNSYYKAIFDPVHKYNGYVSDVIGDAMLAIWTDKSPSEFLHQQACIAALEIQKSARDFNQLTPGFTLPTRIGLHSGNLVIGHVGAEAHYEYRAVGDIVNTATRIEGLNKILSTNILATSDIVKNIENITTRDLGKFLLSGKENIVHIFELSGFNCDIDNTILQRNRLFSAGLDKFNEQNWSEALITFQEMIDLYDSDGPSQVYKAVCTQLLSPVCDNEQHLPFCYHKGAIKINKK